MDFSASHASFVFVSYALTAACLLALCVYIFGRDRSMAQKLKRLNEKTDT
jgi:heme exporter protein CcmD